MPNETRTTVRQIELRANDSMGMIGGYAALFNSPTDIGEFFKEYITPGAFSGSLGNDVRALINHDSGRVIGRTKSGSLRLTEDETGLGFEIDLPDTQDARDLRALIDRGDISGMSIGFVVTKQVWDETDPEKPVRMIEAIDLREVSVVAFPAYDNTSVALRDLEHARAERRRHNFEYASARISRKVRLDLRDRGIESKG